MHLHGKTSCKRLYLAVLHLSKTKALHRVKMQGKRKARPFLTGWNASYLLALNSALKNQNAKRMQEKITCHAPLYHAKTLVGGALAAFGVYIRVRCL